MRALYTLGEIRVSQRFLALAFFFLRRFCYWPIVVTLYLFSNGPYIDGLGLITG